MLNNKLIIANAKFAVNIGSHANGNISVSPTGKQLPGKIITITLTPNTHYKFSSVSVTKASGGIVSLTTVTSGSKYTFKMPAANVTVNASFSALPTYSISINASGGSVRASKTSGIYAGEKITLTCTPNTYYQLSSITSPQVSLSGSGNTRTFTMPSKNVTINATFVARYTHIIIVAVDDDGSPSGRYKYENRYGFYITAGAISPNKFNNYTINALYSIEGNNYDNESNKDHYYRREILTIQNSPYSSYTVTRLDTNESQVFPYEDSSDHRDFYDETFFKSSDAGKNIYLKIVANN